MLDLLHEQLRARIDADARVWLDDAIAAAARGSKSELVRAYTDASRHLGRAAWLTGPLNTAASDAAAAAAAAGVSFERWTLEDVGRLVLLLSCYNGVPDAADAEAAALHCYEQGDVREQLSWLRGVALLPHPERFLALAVDACRTSILPLFEAIACENPYPASHFPERNFNQMVLKALFNGIALDRIDGLPARRNGELSRMARDYAAERRAAGRTVPPDISLAMLETMAP